MSGYASDDSDDTVSAGYAFDLPEYDLRGLRIFVGSRRQASVDGDPRFDRLEWLVGQKHGEEDREQNDIGFDRGFIGRRNPLSQQMGQAINLALSMMETQKSIEIMTRVAQRLVHDPSLQYAICHIGPESTQVEVQTLARNWIAKLRNQEFLKIQLVHMDQANSGAYICHWRRFTGMKLATIADYYPHKAGMLRLDVKIVEKLAYHAASSHAHSPIEREKCLFHVANLIINQAQWFWVAFLIPAQCKRGATQPMSVYSEATIGLLGSSQNPSAGYHWDAEFFGGLVRMRHNKDNPSTKFNQHGGFGRILSIGDAYLNRADGTEQLIAIDSITRCTSCDFSGVSSHGLGTQGISVPAWGFPFLDYSAPEGE